MEQSGCLEGIGTGRIQRIVMGKVKMDVDLLEGFKELVRREKIRTGVILSGIGALKKATFRNLKILPPDFKVQDHHRLYLDLDQPMEIVSLTGWIATLENGEPETHAHFSASTVMGDYGRHSGRSPDLWNDHLGEGGGSHWGDRGDQHQSRDGPAPKPDGCEAASLDFSFAAGVPCLP